VSIAARRAVRLARHEAASGGFGEVGTEHLLLGVLQCGDRDASHVLERLGVTLNVARDAVEPTTERTLGSARASHEQPAAGTAAAPISPVAKRTLERALARASARGGGRLTALDILYCVLGHRDAGATRTLERLGVDAGNARERISELEAAA
jgi:ATP-dependent Clp protease ATP-binding subunit ClpC